MSQFIEEIGDPRTNPKNWPIKKLSELSTYTIGLTYKPEDVSEDGIIVLRSGNIQESKLTLTDTVRVNCQIKESLYVKEDDILMCSRNGSAALVGKVAQIKSVNEPMTYGAFMTIIRSEYSDYLFLYFQSNAFREQVSTGKSSTMNQITQKMLDKICLPFPDEDTRKRLSAILHQADKSEFDGLKSQFIEMFTNNNFEMVPLGDLCDKISDGSHNPPKGIENSKYLMISSKNVFKDHLDLTDVRYLTEEDFEVENKRTNVKANDVLLTIVGTIGRTYLVKGDEGNLVMQRSVAVLTPNSRVTPLFLMFYLHSDKNLEKEGRGNAQKGIYLKQLSQYEIKVPSIDLQKQFEAIYRQADKSESAQELVRNINYN